MEFRILGPIEVRAGGDQLDLGGLRQRRVLAAMLVSPNRAVPMATLVEVGWGDDPPATVRRQVRNRVAELRAVLTRAGGFINTDGDGYRLRVAEGELDAVVFAELAHRGRSTGDSRLLREALALWRGPALAGLVRSAGDPLGREAARLEEQRLAVWEDCLELELSHAGQEAALARLEALVTDHPLRERLVGLWMTALYRSGRRAEALHAYQALASRLAEELGVDPSAPLRRIHEMVLRDDRAPSSGVGPAPAQLPRDVPGFTGRIDGLTALDRLLSDGQSWRTAVISAIAGTAGVGKTAL